LLYHSYIAILRNSNTNINEAILLGKDIRDPRSADLISRLLCHLIEDDSSHRREWIINERLSLSHGECANASPPMLIQYVAV